MAQNAVAPSKNPNVAATGPPPLNAESIKSIDSTAMSTPPPKPIIAATMRWDSRPPKLTANNAPIRSPEAASSPQSAACANNGTFLLLKHRTDENSHVIQREMSVRHSRAHLRSAGNVSSYDTNCNATPLLQ